MQSLGSRTENPGLSSQSGQTKSLTQVGQISFVNTLPVVLPLLRGAIQTDFHLTFGTPAELNTKLQQQELHLGAMSSFYFLEDGGFELFPGLSISGCRRVGSVLLFSKVELKELAGKLVSIPDCSATSIKLLQLLLREEFGIAPILQRQSDLANSANEAVAELLIGDEALKRDQAQHGELRVDLAQWWFSSFSLPFVFGVWGARKNWAQDNQDRFRRIGESLVQACKLGLTGMLPEVINEAALRTGLKHERLGSYYLNELDYRLEDEHIRALRLFRHLCCKHGFLQAE